MAAAADRDVRQALHTALDQMCDQLGRELVAERETNSRFLHRLLQLVKDGEPIESVLQQHLRRETEPIDAPLEAVASLKTDLCNLRRRFNALSANFNTAKNALQERTRSRDGWIRHASHLERLIADAEKKHGIKIIFPKGRSPAAAATPRQYSPAPGARPDDSRDANSEQRAAADVPLGFTQGDSDEEQQLPPMPNHQPCDSEPRQPASEPSSDIPVVISERSVRKKRRNDSAPAAVKPRVKMEPSENSSPPSAIRFAARSDSDTQRSLDLGDIAKKIETPRKRKRMADLDSRYISIASDHFVPSVTRSTAASTPIEPPRRATDTRKESALTPLSVNVRAQRSGQSDSKVRPLKRGVAHAISALAEDGDSHGAHPHASRNQDAASITPLAKGRLSTLPNSTSSAPDDTVLSRSADPRSLPIPQRRELPFEKTPNAQASKPSRPKKERTGPSPETAPTRDRPLRQGKASSLRNKPLSELQLEDFKINPQANNGHDYAFTEVVRDKAERSCLPGCTDMHCCGKQFTALARSQRPDPPLTPAGRMEEQKLLEDYLGDAAYRLASMSGPERAELWVEAKAQELANRYGKHRHRFSRMQSPPGFWNADFPSTQELALDRVEAAKRERLAVAERHREATRPGGRWLFRDE
ncbi:hypothetical protein L249_1956 [Ophiocordyceps polyrhachis-furcata BCC 54312]|uniref:DNA endonuclease activator Ctp1 C-terminal domain-containing protein n=1 Tax=Ophiocordyceps polyrhachis-furcata BCC 54312 TaxID=1330021 RepID=A0A367LND0_9HYPO|nr:hypothetical protein L249_1956 [Ophiocordyceps polyrhachis-furcata BCC 54312]